MSKTPTPAALLKKARLQPQVENVRLLGDYAVAICVLRKKGFTWKGIREWLASNGLNYSMGQIMNVAKKADRK